MKDLARQKIFETLLIFKVSAQTQLKSTKAKTNYSADRITVFCFEAGSSKTFESKDLRKLSNLNTKLSTAILKCPRHPHV